MPHLELSTRGPDPQHLRNPVVQLQVEGFKPGDENDADLEGYNKEELNQEVTTECEEGNPSQLCQPLQLHRMVRYLTVRLSLSDPCDPPPPAAGPRCCSASASLRSLCCRMWADARSASPRAEDSWESTEGDGRVWKGGIVLREKKGGIHSQEDMEVSGLPAGMISKHRLTFSQLLHIPYHALPLAPPAPPSQSSSSVTSAC